MATRYRKNRFNRVCRFFHLGKLFSSDRDADSSDRDDYLETGLNTTVILLQQLFYAAVIKGNASKMYGI